MTEVERPAGPHLTVRAGPQAFVGGQRAEIPGRGDLIIEIVGAPPGQDVEIVVGNRHLSVPADAEGAAEWRGEGLLEGLVGELVITALHQKVDLLVRPGKLLSALVDRLVEDLEAFAEGLSADPGGWAVGGRVGGQDGRLRTLDQAVGLASSAAAGIRRRPVVRTRARYGLSAQRAAPMGAAELRWLATHPAQVAARALPGRPPSVRRTLEIDPDTAENRGVQRVWQRLGERLDELGANLRAEIARLDEARPASEAFLTASGNLWTEKEGPRREAWLRRLAHAEALSRELVATRARSGLPPLHPLPPTMVRSHRVDAEPAYWATWQAGLLADQARPPPTRAPVKNLDELWEIWASIHLGQALARHLGPPHDDGAVRRGWFATLAHGTLATWLVADARIALIYEPELRYGEGPIQKLHPGKPWRPDLLVTVDRGEGGLEVHVFDAKFRVTPGWTEPAWEPWREVREKYGESIGGPDGFPAVASVWTLCPARRSRLEGPRMLDPHWPKGRLRGGAVGLWPGQAPADLDAVVRALLG